MKTSWFVDSWLKSTVYTYLPYEFLTSKKPWKWLNIYIEPKCWKFPSYWTITWSEFGLVHWSVQKEAHLRWYGCISNSHFAPAKLSWAEKNFIQGRKRKNHEVQVLAHADILNVCNQVFIFNKEWKNFHLTALAMCTRRHVDAASYMLMAEILHWGDSSLSYLLIYIPSGAGFVANSKKHPRFAYPGYLHRLGRAERL